jgi:5-formyltetrahydrofolate cyclo-ligase
MTLRCRPNQKMGETMKNEEKDRIRKQMRRQRRDYADGDRDSRRMGEILTASPLYRQAQQLLAYAPFRQEPDLVPVLRQAEAEGKEVGIPQMIGPGRMIFRRGADPSRWRNNAWGIAEPGEEAEPIEPQPGCLILVPALAFDRRGYRLGYGGGYYDRYLERYPKVEAIGVAFSFQCIDTLPTEPQDRPVSWILTETELRKTEWGLQ